MASTHLLCTGKIERSGDVQWHIAPLTAEDSADDEMYGSEDYPYDEAAELQEYQDWIADQDYWRQGAW